MAVATSLSSSLLSCFRWLRAHSICFSSLKDDQAHAIINYFSYSNEAAYAYNKAVNYFAKNSGKLKLLSAKYKHHYFLDYAVTIKYKSLDGKTTFAFSDIGIM